MSEKKSISTVGELIDELSKFSREEPIYGLWDTMFWPVRRVEYYKEGVAINVDKWGFGYERARSQIAAERADGVGRKQQDGVYEVEQGHKQEHR